MRINVPVNAQVNGNWECDFLGHAWNVTKTVAVWIACAAIIALFTTMGYCMSKFGSEAVLPWVLVLIIGGVVVGFGIRAVREQPTGMGRFGAVVMILLIVAMLVVGAVIFQKMMATETQTTSAPVPIILSPVPEKPMVAVPAVPTRIEVEHKVKGGFSVQVRDAPLLPHSVAREETPLEDPCDPGGEKASAWGRRE